MPGNKHNVVVRKAEPGRQYCHVLRGCTETPGFCYYSQPVLTVQTKEKVKHFSLNDALIKPLFSEEFPQFLSETKLAKIHIIYRINIKVYICETAGNDRKIVLTSS
jgi:hypothetical protein